MLLSIVPLRTVFHTARPGTSIRPKIPNPAPINAVSRLLAPHVTFVELNPPVPVDHTQAPLLNCRVGRPVSPVTLQEMQRMHAEGWSIGRLAKHYGVSRLMVIKRVLPPAQQTALQAEIDGRLQRASTRVQRGWVLRHRIRYDRQQND